ncbi:DUF58 domain-containing protein [Candidatus Woesearchaeota archaeon]|nr:DUF58 domain-containing protein [Candidatus Woesearchaeota archaeon]MBW2993965.1 DUF58 domain-containing protein [Candidatus Woesearchaeota archaeon]
MIDTTFLHQLDKLSLIINKRITSNYAGEHQTNAAGKGMIFKDHSMYTPGDDFRAIDWKVFARTDKLYVKSFEEERNLVVHIIVDYSGSMGFGLGRTKKSDYAAMIGLGFAYMALRNNEKFVLSTFADKLEMFKPKKGRKQIIAILDYLNQRKPKGASNFSLSLARYKQLINARSFVVIVSDFLYDVDQIKQVLYRYKTHDIALVQVLDKLETDLDLDGDYKLTDSETKEHMRTFITPYTRQKYQEQLESHKADIKNACDEVGAKFFSFSTDKPVFDAFYEMLR